MAKKIKQFRFYEENSPNNYPSSSDLANMLPNGESSFMKALINGTLFSKYEIYQLGIQTLPGTKFYVQNTTNPVIVGSTGIYELDLLNESITIDALSFDAVSIANINSNPNTYLIIDIIYEEVSG